MNKEQGREIILKSSTSRAWAFRSHILSGAGLLGFSLFRGPLVSPSLTIAISALICVGLQNLNLASANEESLANLCSLVEGVEGAVLLLGDILLRDP